MPVPVRLSTDKESLLAATFIGARPPLNGNIILKSSFCFSKPLGIPLEEVADAGGRRIQNYLSNFRKKSALESPLNSPFGN